MFCLYEKDTVPDEFLDFIVNVSASLSATSTPEYSVLVDEHPVRSNTTITIRYLMQDRVSYFRHLTGYIEMSEDPFSAAVLKRSIFQCAHSINLDGRFILGRKSQVRVLVNGTVKKTAGQKITFLSQPAVLQEV